MKTIKIGALICAGMLLVVYYFLVTFRPGGPGGEAVQRRMIATILEGVESGERELSAILGDPDFSRTYKQKSALVGDYKYGESIYRTKHATLVVYWKILLEIGAKSEVFAVNWIDLGGNEGGVWLRLNEKELGIYSEARQGD